MTELEEYARRLNVTKFRGWPVDEAAWELAKERTGSRYPDIEPLSVEYCAIVITEYFNQETS